MGLISAVFSILTIIVGGVCIMLFVSTKTLRDSRDDQEKRIKFLEEERTRDKKQIASLETAVTFWRSAATGDEKLQKILDLLDTHHKDALTHWVQVTAGLGHVGTTLDNVSGSMDSVSESVDHLIEAIGGKE